jgi:hypothetical protein
MCNSGFAVRTTKRHGGCVLDWHNLGYVMDGAWQRGLGIGKLVPWSAVPWNVAYVQIRRVGIKNRIYGVIDARAVVLLVPQPY